MAHAQLPLVRRGFGETVRRDAWWTQPALVFGILAAFVIYATWAALQGRYYHFGPYLSPFYSPELFGESPHRWFGPRPAWWPGWLVFSPALLILPFPALFRFTCYYYRGAYYKAFWADPPACAVGEPRTGYRGERSFPLIVQNVHRYVLYIAILFLFVLSYDAYQSFWFADARAEGGRAFGIGLGTLILTANVICLSGYTLGCHSLRHLVGGMVDRLSERPIQRACYAGCGKLNRAHLRWAWASLFSVAFADLYVRMCAMGVWQDWRLV
jgi:hypothetical protein